ncbi:hypothetical protein JHK84_028088 [Glycine max]|uniref:Uncharacterized protein n=1 Tax=Glycine max TaxID=3847 RepID=A0A0R0HS60_SOYBN|nr:hypothetical protein JHK85_028503 [Glycine max]KAG5003835.1 hypothetical protein JHK86_027974 [Glycine max]KAG5151616.1 hypothetical protein JHK84_028088 [Glycine max]
MTNMDLIDQHVEGGGSIIHVVDHIDLDNHKKYWLRNWQLLIVKLTLQTLQHIRQIAQESSGEIQYGGGHQLAVLRTFSHRLCRGFNDVVNGFVDDGWSLMGWKM